MFYLMTNLYERPSPRYGYRPWAFAGRPGCGWLPARPSCLPHHPTPLYLTLRPLACFPLVSLTLRSQTKNEKNQTPTQNSTSPAIL